MAGSEGSMMRLAFGMAAVFACAAGVAVAQQPGSAAKPAHNTFVLAGCLEAPVTESPAFRLASAAPVGQAPPSSPTQPPGTQTGTTGTKPVYQLQPVSGVNQSGLDANALKLHVGHRVEVTVRPVETVAPAALPTATAPAQGTAAPVEPAPQRFSVIAVKRIGGTCG